MNDSSDHRRPDRALAGKFLLLSAVSAASFLLLAHAVAERDTASIDRRVEKKVKEKARRRLRNAARRLHPVGKWWTYVPAAGAVATALIVSSEHPDGGGNRSRRMGAASVAGSAIAAALLNEILDDLVPQPPAPPGRPSPRHPVFPSGHTFGTASVGLTSAWVLSREGTVRPSIGFPVALLIPATSASARMLEDKHWLSDIAGGILVALTVSSLWIATYEWTSRAPGRRTSHQRSNPTGSAGAIFSRRPADRASNGRHP